MDSRRSRTASIPRPSTAIASQAAFAGCLAVIDVERQSLLTTLPPSVALPRNDSTTYPCIVAFGELTDGITFLGGLPLRWDIRYHELMVAIPFVLWDRAPGEHLFIPGMMCDFVPAVWIGNVYYGFRKRFAQMNWDGERFSAAEENQQPSFWAALGSHRQAPGSSLGWIRSAAALSVLSHRQDGLFVVSRFDWDFQEAAVEAASLHLTLGRQFRELPKGEYTACHDHAYRVRRMRWRLSWPTIATLP